MEWLFSVVLIPVFAFIVKAWLRSRKEINDKINALEARLLAAEFKIDELTDDIEEVKTIRDDLGEVKLDIREIKTLLKNNINN